MVLLIKTRIIMIFDMPWKLIDYSVAPGKTYNFDEKTGVRK